MKQVLIIILLSIIASISYGQSCKKRYKNKLEPDAKLIKCGENYTFEKLPNGNCILKRYYTENKVITHFLTAKNELFKEKHGLYQERWDDGTIVKTGMYANNEKQGEWRENVNEVGMYTNGLKEGSWKTYNGDLIIKETNYRNGKLHGKEIEYDSIGQVILEQEFKYGKLISTTLDTTIEIEDEKPRFPGCETKNLTKEEVEQCTQKTMLEYIYSNFKYPKKARELEIQGNAIVKFAIDTDGSVTDIKVLNGISKDIKEEVLKLINNMPRWKPGIQNGVPVKVQYTLPIKLNLT